MDCTQALSPNLHHGLLEICFSQEQPLYRLQITYPHVLKSSTGS